MVTKEKTKHDRTRQLILTTLIGAILDEMIVFWNEAAGVIIDHTHSFLAAMTYKDFEDDDAKYADRIRRTRMSIVVSKMEDKTRPLSEAFRLLLQELWDVDLEEQINRSWKPVLSHLQASLSPEWSIALDKDFIVTMVYDLLTFTGHMDDLQLKCLFLKTLTKTIMAIHAGKTILGLTYGTIKHKLAQSEAWTPFLDFEAFLWLIKNWPDYFEIFIGGMKKYLDTRHYRMVEHLGLRLLIVGYCSYHSSPTFDHMANRTTFIGNVVNGKHYRIASQIKQWEYPMCIRRHPIIMNHLFSNDMSTKHIPAKSSPYAIPMCMGLVYKNMAQILTAYGKARYKNNEGLRSRLVNAPTFTGSWEAILANYVTDIYPLTLTDMESMHKTVDNLHEIDPKHQPKLLFGISRFVKNLDDSRGM